MTQQTNGFMRFAYGVKAGLNAGNTNALFIDMVAHELLGWAGNAKPDMTGPALQNALALRTYLRRQVGSYTVEAVAFVVSENNTIELSGATLNNAIDAASKIFTQQDNSGQIEFAGSSFKGGKTITAMRYSGKIENVAAIDFAVVDNGSPKIFMLTTDGAKVFDLATKKWSGIMIDGVSPAELAEVTGVTRFTQIGTDGAIYTTLFAKKGGEQIAIELNRNLRGVYELKVLNRFNFTKKTNAKLNDDTIVEFVGPIAGTTDQVGGFNANGQVIRLNRTELTTLLEGVHAPKQLITAYAPPGYGL